MHKNCNMNIYNIIKIFNKIRSTRLKLFTIYIMYIAKRRFLSLYVDPVIACNLRCQMCYFSSDNYKHEKLEKRILDINEFSLFAKSIFNRAIKVQIGCGAEPTLYSHLEELVKIAKQHKVPYISLTTNGNLLKSETLYNMVKNGLNEITISSHGITRETYEKLMQSFKERLQKKIQLLTDGTYQLGAFSEFGLRRRLSAEAQELAIQELAKANYPYSKFVGTSNVYLAKNFGLTPVGTMAHEWIMCVGQGNHKHNPAYSNWYALDAWVKEYGVLNGTALTDAITTDCFLKDFQLTYATLFSGLRHDSGDPIEWGDKMIEHYKALEIDPKTKTLLFSDSLNFEKADKLYRYFKDKAKVAFGIGTYIANDTDVPALNIVMKTTACNGMDVAKISDTPGKGMCKNPDYVHYLQRCIDWRMENE